MHGEEKDLASTRETFLIFFDGVRFVLRTRLRKDLFKHLKGNPYIIQHGCLLCNLYAVVLGTGLN